MTTHKATIPIVVGVTAHRSIREADRPAITESVRKELMRLQALCPNSELMMLTSLAEGGDTLCADVAEALHIPLLVALPRPLEDYQNDFSEHGKERLFHHCKLARQVFVAPATETKLPEARERDFQFRQAGIYVATHCHILLALWDGGPGTAAACGAAEAVDFVLHGNYCPVSGATPRADRGDAVIHIFTPRGERTGEAGKAVWLGKAKKPRRNKDNKAIESILKSTDTFNRQAKNTPQPTPSLPLENCEYDPVLDRMQAVRDMAGALSRKYATTFRRILASIAVFYSLLAFSFLIYDEVRLIWMILICGAMLIFSLFSVQYVSLSKCHQQYLEYRALAEALRVQVYLRYAGSSIQASDLLSWTQQEETVWVLDALCGLSIGAAPQERRDIRSCWVEKQKSYHESKKKLFGKKKKTSEIIITSALVLSITLYLSAVVFEFLCGGLFFKPSFLLADVEFYRTLLKILLGTISSVTLFVSNYYGRTSLVRSRSDHEKMERFYSRMSVHLNNFGQTEELLRALAREELIENGNWYSYQKDNKPDVSI